MSIDKHLHSSSLIRVFCHFTEVLLVILPFLLAIPHSYLHFLTSRGPFTCVPAYDLTFIPAQVPTSSSGKV